MPLNADVVGMTPGFVGGDVTPFLEHPGATAQGMYGSLYGMEEGGLTPPQVGGMTPGFDSQAGAATPLLATSAQI